MRTSIVTSSSSLSWVEIYLYLPSIEERLKRLSNDVCTLQSQNHICERRIYQLKSQIATTSGLLNSLRISCERERREIENLYNEKSRLDAIVREFKSNEERYLKFKETIEEEVF